LKVVDNVVRQNFVQPFQRGLTAISTSIATGIENTTMRLMGANVIDSSTVTGSSIKRGEAAAAAGMRESELGVADASGNMVQRMLGGGQSGERLAGALMSEGGALGGIAAQTFSSVEEVQAAQKAKGERFMILSHSAGGGDKPIVAVPTSQLRAHEKQRRETEPTKKDMEAAEKFRLSDSQIVSLEDLRMGQESTGKAATLQQVGSAMFGSGFHDTGMTSAQRAILGKVLPGQRLAGALGTFNAITGSGSSDAEARASAGDFDSGKRLFESARNRLSSALSMDASMGGNEAWRASRNLNSEQLKLVSDLAVAVDPTTKRLLRAKLGDSGLSEHTISSLDTAVARDLKSDQKQEIWDKIHTADFANYTAQQGKAAAMGIGADKLAAGGATIGQVGQEAVTQMSNMSAQLVKNMELLIALQKQFNAAMGSR
jgi:hypothetical protein